MKRIKGEIMKLKELIKKNDTIYYFVVKVSPSGMSRHIRFFKIENNQIEHLTYNICKELNYKYKNITNGLYVSGCGMDMGFHIISNLSYYLFKKEGCLKYRVL